MISILYPNSPVTETKYEFIYDVSLYRISVAFNPPALSYV